MGNAKALEIWTAQTLCNVGVLLSMVSFLLHIGRPYFDRILSRLTLRVAADLWWLTYVVLRDGSLFVALVCGVFCLNLDLMADIKIGLPFVPLGTVALAGAVLVKVFRNAEDINKSFRLSLFLVALGALLNTIGYVLVMEAPGAEYAAAKTGFWQMMAALRSNQNTALAEITFYLAFAMLLALGAAAMLMAARYYGRAARDQGASNVPA
jgi:uncharacterized protein (UPF0333 family)